MALIPFDDRDGYIWMDGKIIDWRDAKLHVCSHGLHYGSCVFEGERAYGGKIFKSLEHTQRLHKSAELLGFKIPYSVEEIEKAKQELIEKNNLVDAYFRPVAWRGSEMMAISAQQTKIHVAIATWDWPSYFGKEAKQRGLSLITSKWTRPAPHMAPTASKAAGLYMICTMSKHDAEAQGHNDALMHDYRGYLAEATGANLFLVIDGKIHTPTPDCILDGITRRTVMDLARKEGMEVIERHIKPEELKNATEAFLTGTAAEVTPIGKVDDISFTVGNVCNTLMDAYEKAVNA